jgi:non-ribosomal peptide synthetase component F
MTPVPHADAASNGQELAANWSQALEHGLLRLQRWPNLSRMPATVDVRIAARVCALLARRPTVGCFIPRLLDQPRLQVAPVLEALHLQRVIEVTSLAPVSAGRPADPIPVLPSARFIAQLWGLFMH